MRLKQNGQDYLKTGRMPYEIQLPISNQWTGEFTDLPKYNSAGEEFEYTVEESYTGQEQYIAESVTSKGETGPVITITNTLDTVEVEVEKVWVDNNDPNRPGYITVELHRNGTLYNNMRTNIRAENGWKHIFNRLPRLDSDGVPYTYPIAEDFYGKGTEYDSEISEMEETPEGYKYTITNIKNYVGTIPTVRKIITGKIPEGGETYTFTLTPITPDAPMPRNADGGVTDRITISSSDSPRTASFGDIQFDADLGPGPYVYEVRELAGSNPNCTYDSSVFEVSMSIENGSVTVTLKKNGTAWSEQAMRFYNDYPTEGWNEPQVLKVITGKAPNPEETYTFELIRISPNAPMPEGSVNGVKTITITGSRVSSFGPVTFTDDGEYQYRVHEVPGSTPGVKYDDLDYIAVITVKDGLVTKKLYKETISDSTLIDYAKEPYFEHDVYKFTNAYPVDYPIVEPAVRKVIRDGEPESGDRFYFKLEAVSKPEGVAEWPMPVLPDDERTKIIDIDADDIRNDVSVSFGKIQFRKLGIYVYKISEVEGTLSRYQYDDNYFTLTYDVHVDDRTGEIVATQHAVNKSGTTIHPEETLGNAFTFRNPVKLDGAADDIHVEKVITGYETGSASSFQFTLTLNEMPKDLTEVPMPEDFTSRAVECLGSEDRKVLTCTLKGASQNV